MHPGKSQCEHIDEFHKLIGDLAAIYTLEYVLAILNFRELQKMIEAKGDVGEGLYVRGRSGLRDMEQGTYSAWSKSHGRSTRLRECHVQGTCMVQVHMRDGSSFVLDNVRYVPELRQNIISLGTLEKEAFTMKTQSGKIKDIRGSQVVLSGIRRANGIRH
ncbi:hypothetical protein Tco_0425956 [Tanacetum coccineum]